MKSARLKGGGLNLRYGNQRAAIPLLSSAPYDGGPFPQERHAGGINRRTHE